MDLSKYWVGIVMVTGNIVFPPQDNDDTQSKLRPERLGKLMENARLRGWVIIRNTMPTKRFAQLSVSEKKQIEILFLNRNVEFIKFMNIIGQSFTIKRDDFLNPQKPKSALYINSEAQGVDDESLDAALDFYNAKIKTNEQGNTLESTI